MESAERDGRRLAYVRRGSGKAIIFVHGWCGSRRHFDPQVAHFSRTHDVVAVDLRGHGGSDRATSYTVGDFADDVAWTARSLDLDEPVVVGHSLGGMVAVEVGASHPELFRAVVALDALLFDDTAAVEGMRAQLEMFYSGHWNEGGARFLRSALIGPYDDPDTSARLIQGMMDVPEEVSVPTLESGREWPAQRRLLSCPQPVLCIHTRCGGPKDPSQMCEGQGNIHVAQTVGSGHFVQLQVPDQVNAMIERFLEVFRS